MSTRPDDESAEGMTILPSAHTPEPEYEPGDLIASAQPIKPRPGGSRVNPHGVRRSMDGFSANSAPTAKPQQPHRAQRAPQGPPAQWQPSASSGPQAGQPMPSPYPYQAYPHAQAQPYRRPPMSTVGIYGAGLTLISVILAVLGPFVPFLEMGASISLWSAETGSANSYVILAAALIGLVGGIIMMMSLVRPKCGTAGGILSMVAGAVTGGMAAYLLTNSDHRALIAQGGSFGVAAWLLIAATGGLLVGGILGVVRGTTTN